MAESSSAPRVPGTAMFLTGNAQDVPAALLHNMKHNKVLHDQNVILTVVTEEVPRLPDEGRVTVEKLSDRFSRVIVRFGFMESPNVPKALRGGELRPGERLVLPVAAGAASLGPIRAAAVAGLHLHPDGALRQRRVGPLLHPGGSRGRGRRTDHDLTGATAWAQEARRGGRFLCDVCLSSHPGPITGRLACKRATRRNRGSRTRPSASPILCQDLKSHSHVYGMSPVSEVRSTFRETSKFFQDCRAIPRATMDNPPERMALFHIRFWRWSIATSQPQEANPGLHSP